MRKLLSSRTPTILHYATEINEETCNTGQGPWVYPESASPLQHQQTPEEVLMRNAFLFRVPGQHGMYDFDEIKAMNLQRSKTLAVTEITSQHHSRGVGKMSVASILSKFG